MSKILDAQDLLNEVRDFIECIGMAAAASHLEPEFGAPIAAVANAASQKIEDAIALLEGIPVPAAPRAEPGAPATRTKGRGK